MEACSKNSFSEGRHRAPRARKQPQKTKTMGAHPPSAAPLFDYIRPAPLLRGFLAARKKNRPAPLLQFRTGRPRALSPQLAVVFEKRCVGVLEDTVTLKPDPKRNKKKNVCYQADTSQGFHLTLHPRFGGQRWLRLSVGTSCAHGLAGQMTWNNYGVVFAVLR